MGVEGLQKVGVEAVVEGLSQFKSDMGDVNKALDMLRPQPTLLQQAFSWAGDALQGFAQSAIHVAEYALGGILRDAIEGTIALIGDLVRETISAGNEFQTLQLRLENFNMAAAIKAGKSYDQALKESKQLTQDQINWIMQLSIPTPYDAADIANIYTLGRAYGFTDEQVRQLTENTVQFASAMALPTNGLDKITYNLGQMVQRGKITSTEIRDLARGSFLPIGDILQRIADNMNTMTNVTDGAGNALENMGWTVAKVTKQIQSPEGLPAQYFIDAFNQMIEQEPQFQDAANRMAKTAQSALKNVMEFIRDVGGKYIVQPALDVFGPWLADIINQISKPGNLARITSSAQKVGDQLADIIGQILGMAPDTGTFIDKIVKGLDWVAEFLRENKDDIVQFFKDMVKNIKEAANWIRTVLIPAISTFIQWVTDHKDEIIFWAKALGIAFLAWQIGATILQIIVSGLISLLGFALALAGLVATIIALGDAFVIALALIASFIFFIMSVVLWIGLAIAGFLFWKTIIEDLGNILQNAFAQALSIVQDNIAQIMDAWNRGDWVGVGIAIVQGIANGILGSSGILYGIIDQIALGMINNALKPFGLQTSLESPMGGTAGFSVLPSGTSNSYSTQNNFNLSVQTSAPREPIIQDFNTMRSLAGAAGSAGGRR